MNFIPKKKVEEPSRALPLRTPNPNNLPTGQIDLRRTETKEPDSHRADESMLTKNFSHSLFCVKQRKKPLKWSDQDTKTFYKCLEVFGTDFSMIKEVLTHMTQRQVVRKFHKEKKRNPAFVDAALQLHETNLISKDSKSYSFLENLFIQTSDSEFFSENNSDNSLEEAVNHKLRLINDQSQCNEMECEDEPIQSLDYYLKD